MLASFVLGAVSEDRADGQRTAQPMWPGELRQTVVSLWAVCGSLTMVLYASLQSLPDRSIFPLSSGLPRQAGGRYCGTI